MLSSTKPAVMRSVFRLLPLRRVLIGLVSVTILLLLLNNLTVEQKQPEELHDPCRWPPVNIADMRSGDAFNLWICFRSTARAFENGKVEKRYRMDEIFKVNSTNETISFREMVNMSDSLQHKIRYPEIWNTYPQDVPIKEIIPKIRAGQPIDHVSLEHW